ncbi:tetratricopeptide repeat protein [Laspinema palackyanum]|uniref:tetratricopeptide repeat protein n=1 Tax=Laspinema palackyanum TaxID=3231601 RepID=UPI00345D8F0F|nr:tetratricopeptide repeat protein [Laspinema sp. D2c]
MDKRVESLIQEAEAYYRQGKFEAARSICYQLIQVQPDFAPSYKLLGNILQLSGKLEAAIRAYQSGIDLFEKTSKGSIQLGECYADLGDSLIKIGAIEKAIACLEKQIILQPNSAEAYCTLGILLHEVEDRKRAFDCFTTAIQIKPNLAEAYGNLANLLAELNQVSEAVNCLRKAIILKPDLAELSGNLGALLFEQGKFKESIFYLKKAIEIKPDYANAYHKLGQVFQQSNQLEEAVACLQKASELQPDFAAAYGNLGMSLQLQGKLCEAIAAFHKAFQLQPDLSLLFFKGQKHLEDTLEQLVAFPNTPPKTVCLSIANIAVDLDTNKPDLTYIKINFGQSVYLRAPKNSSGNFPQVPPNLQERWGEFPERYLAILPNGRAWGDLITTAILTEQNQLLAELSTGNVAHFTQVNKLPTIKKFDGTIAFLSTIGGDTYYHWMMDILPRFKSLQFQGIDWDAIDKFVVNNYTRAFQRETLKVLGIPQEKIITSVEYPHIQASQLIVPSVPSSIPKWFGNYIQGVPPWVCKFLRQELMPLAGPNPLKGYERIYISRQRSQFRRFVNEEEILDCLGKFGFKMVILESFSVSEQIAIMAAAKAIVAPHGAGLSNAVFCQPGTKLIEIFAPRYVENCYWILSNHINLDYYYLIGESLEKYYATRPQIRPLKRLYKDARTDDIYVKIDSLLKLINFANLAY